MATRNKPGVGAEKMGSKKKIMSGRNANSLTAEENKMSSPPAG